LNVKDAVDVRPTVVPTTSGRRVEPERDRQLRHIGAGTGSPRVDELFTARPAKCERFCVALVGWTANVTLNATVIATAATQFRRVVVSFVSKLALSASPFTTR